MMTSVPSAALDPAIAGRVLRRAMLDHDLGIKEAAHRLRRSCGTVKRALNGSMGPRTAYRINQEFGETFALLSRDGSAPPGP